MVKRFAIGFALAGSLIPVWGYDFDFAPITSPDVRYFVQNVCLEWPVYRFGHSRTITLILLASINALFFGTVGWVVARAIRRQPKAVRDPRSRITVRRFVFYFAAAGYVLPIWFYGLYFHPVPWVGVLEPACIVCINDAHPNAVGVLGIGGPINAVYLGLIGWVVGRALRRRPPAIAETITPPPATAMPS